jgi:hypothetical protein
MEDANFLWLLNWYQDHCNRDWEHGKGIHIGTIDNPGWSLSVEIEDTEIENKQFDKIEIERSENDWLVCFIHGGKFEGRCGTGNLPDILHIFRCWAENLNH